MATLPQHQHGHNPMCQQCRGLHHHLTDLMQERDFLAHELDASLLREQDLMQLVRELEQRLGQEEQESHRLTLDLDPEVLFAMQKAATEGKAPWDSLPITHEYRHAEETTW